MFYINVLEQNIAVLLSLLTDNSHFFPESTQHEAHKSMKEVEQKRKLVKLTYVLQEHSAGSAMDQGYLKKISNKKDGS